MIRDKCSICANKLKNIYIENKIPLKLICVEKIEKKTEDLSISQCINCNTIQIDKLIPLDILYSDSHNLISVGKIWKDYFNLLIKELSILSKNKTILEIGDPSGKLANNLYDYIEWFIVDSNKNTNIIFNKNITFIQKFFDNTFTIDKNIDLIVHSHLFEHLYKPNDFLKKCYDILSKDGEMLFGVPDMDFIAKNKLSPFLGLFFEHTIFLNKENITYMLNKNGFKIIKILEYKNHSHIYHIKKSDTIKYDKIFITDYKNLLYETLNKYKIIIDYYNNVINNSNIDVYIHGASYNTQFLLSMGLNCQKIIGIIDNSIEKHNKFFYGFDIKIYNPEIIKNKKIILIIPENLYQKEIKEQMININNSLIII